MVDQRYNPGHIPLSSFKRAPAPAMGGRAAEQRRQDDKRSRSKGDKKGDREKRVGQLDEKNRRGQAGGRDGALVGPANLPPGWMPTPPPS